MRITLNKIKKLVSGRYYGDTALLDKTIKNISINSNDIKNNDLFLGIKGEKFDGDNFAEIAIKKGALAAIVSKDVKNLENKIKAQQQEITSLQTQKDYNNKLVKDFTTLLNAEDRLFEMGESSLFIINSRENSLVSSQINEIALENRYLNAVIGLYKTLANPQ